MLTTAAISLSEELEKIGSFAGLAAFFGFAVLTVLYFAQAREVKRLREWAGRAPERATELEHRVVAAADARRIRAEPRKPAAVAATPAGAAAAATPADAAAGAAGAAQADGAGKPAEPAAVPAAGDGSPAQPVEKQAEEEPAEEKADPAAKPATPAAQPAGTPAAVPAGAAAAGALAAAAAGAASAPGATPATPAAGAPGGTPPAPAPTGAKPPGPPPSTPAATPPPPGPPAAEKAKEEVASGSNGTSTDIPAVPPRATPAPPRPLPPRRPVPAAAPLRSSRPTATPRRAGAVHSQRHDPVSPPDKRGPARLALISGGSVIGLVVLVLVATQLIGGGDDKPPAPNVALNETPTPAPTEDASSTGGGSGTTTRSDVTVAVLNGTTTPGLAATIADRIAGAGFAKGAITNFSDSQRSASLIFYAPDKASAAREVARVLRLTGADRQPMNLDVQNLSNGADVVVVVGADQTQ